MVEIFSFYPNRSEVCQGMEVTYILHVKNAGGVAGTMVVEFTEFTSGGQHRALNTQSRVVGPGESTIFNLSMYANAPPGSTYTICANVTRMLDEIGMVAGNDSMCDSSLVVSTDSGYVTIDSCNVDRTNVDGGEVVRYTALVTNGTWEQRIVYVDFWNSVTNRSLRQMSAMILPDESVPFEYDLLCEELGATYRVCARIVDANGVYLGHTTCAPSVNVSNRYVDTGNGSGGIGPGGRSHGIPVEAIAFVGSIAVGALAIYLLGDKEAWAWE